MMSHVKVVLRAMLRECVSQSVLLVDFGAVSLVALTSSSAVLDGLEFQRESLPSLLQLTPVQRCRGLEVPG